MAASSRRFPLRSSLSARRVLRNLVAFALLYGAGLAAVWGFSLLGVSTLVAFPVFVLGVLITSLETDSGLWGAALGVAYLLSYDFLFTAPLFTLKVLSRTDVAALAIFLVVSLIMGVITHRMSRQVQAAERTAVRFRPLTSGEIERYIATGEPMDKAGAYGIQGRGALFVAHLDGDYFNVMGLPLCRLGQLLNELGVELL